MQHSDILALAGLRVDGRRPGEIRTITHKLGVTQKADGSVYYEQGLNKVIASVHGPQEPERRPPAGGAGAQDRGTISVQVINAPFAGTDWKKRRAGDKRNVETETTIQNTFEGVVHLQHYAKSEIKVVVHVLESDGSTLCAIINAVSLGLMHAGIAMQDMVVACSVGMVKQELCLDCTQVEQGGGAAFMPVAVQARSEDVLLFSLDARLSIANLEEALEVALGGCRQLRAYLEAAMKDHMLLC